ncbi:MAG: DUF4251 domain-containing protein [Bacteroidota bacterium]
MKYMAKILLLSIFSIMFLISNAQEDERQTEKEQRKAEKEKVKKEKKAKEDAEWLVYQKLAKDQTFVVQFEKMTNPRTGKVYIVSRRLNFLYANGENIKIQFETSTYGSENGLGGRTIDGEISNYRYKPPKNDNKPIYINFDITSKFDQQNFNITITVYSGGTALVSFGGGTSDINGTFTAIENASINMGVDMRN